MQRRAMAALAGACLVSAAVWGVTAHAQKKIAWDLKQTEMHGAFRTANMSPLGKTAVTEILGGPTSGSDNAWLLYTRMPPGSKGPAMFTLEVDHLYQVLTGKLTVQIGTDKFEAGPDTGIFIPPNTPHEVWNAGTEAESHIEVIAPAPTRDLLAMLKPAVAKKVDNAAQYVHQATPMPDPLKDGLNAQRLFNRDNSTANEQMRIDNVKPNSGGPEMHMHLFEQVYFVKQGEMTLDYGLLQNLKVPANSFVVVVPGMPHTNRNEGPGIERHATFLIPQPKEGAGQADVRVEIKRNPPPAGRGR